MLTGRDNPGIARWRLFLPSGAVRPDKIHFFRNAYTEGSAMTASGTAGPQHEEAEAPGSLD